MILHDCGWIPEHFSFVNIVYECPIYRPCDENGCPCEIDLYARDFRMTAEGEDARTSATLRTTEAANRVDIEYALGYDHLPMTDLKSAAATFFKGLLIRRTLPLSSSSGVFSFILSIL